jgi:hypothetical protein
METIIQSFGSELYRDRNHVGYKVLVKHMLPLWKKWSKNRDPDMERVNEIVELGVYIPKFIHLAELEGEGLVCYDGNHRREVLKQLVNDNFTCIVDIMFKATHDDVYEAFVNINKGVEVPEIYIEDSANIRSDVMELVKGYETKYKSFISVSPKCRAPQFNRDVLTENISKIYAYLQGQKTIPEIGELLEKLNHEYSRGHLCKSHGTYKSAVIEKCKKHGLWLFLEREVSPEHVERLMHRKKFGIF